ncbi:CLUMA_CG020028, isoform A [Clunio marinus]|uniref:CLUMA_CG020028, isoform A n=1 Tax=Clunio marinus TaxID=568069 RepID=A0A1J1J3J0_9DIPT|nr:CLUMA_CG020028, isoform A [Clunio marinus]
MIGTLTGHCCLYKHLNLMQKTNLINCRYCKGMIEETMQHVIASCDAHSSVRRRILNHTVINAEELAEVDLEDFLLFMRSDPPSSTSSTSSADSEIGRWLNKSQISANLCALGQVKLIEKYTKIVEGEETITLNSIIVLTTSTSKSSHTIDLEEHC